MRLWAIKASLLKENALTVCWNFNNLSLVSLPDAENPTPICRIKPKMRNIQAALISCWVLPFDGNGLKQR
jgi:hypothetical protein